MGFTRLPDSQKMCSHSCRVSWL